MRLFIVMLVSAACGCAATPSRQPNAAAGTIELTGTAGAPITGYYIKDGHRIELDATMPATLPARGITQIALRKARVADDVVVSIHTADGSMRHELRPGHGDGVRIVLAGGMDISVIGPEESLATNTQTIMSIAPYWSEGTWVFDDPAAGLQREPFVKGTPAVIDYLSRDIPNVRSGFRMMFSAQKFPGAQKLIWIAAEDGGNRYRLESPPMEGWLCPAMFRYFSSAPKYLYVRTEPHG